MKKEMSLISLIIAFLVMAIKLIYFTKEALTNNVLFLIIFIIIDALFISTFIYYLKETTKIDENNKKENELIPFIVILVSSLIVYFFGKEFNIDKNITVGLVSLTFGIFIKKYGKEATLGSFIGAGVFITTNYIGVVVVSIIAGVVNLLFKEIFNGLGGKLGTMAFISGLLSFLILKETLGTGTLKDIKDIVFIFIVSIISGVLTFIINNEFKTGPIISYAIVILIGSIFLLFDKTNSLGLSSVVYGAALVGMTNKENFNDYYIISFASLLYGLLFFIGISFTNIGGKAGLLSLISILVVKETFRLINNINFKFKNKAYV